MNAASKPYDGTNKYIRITDIDENTSLYKGEGIVSPDAEIDEQYRVVENDILFARTGASTGKTYIYNPLDGKLYFAGFLIRANVTPKNDSQFVFYQTQTLRYKKWVQIMSMRSGQPGINSQEYSSFSFYYPSLKEQEKIATLIKFLDERIILQNKVIEDLKLLKTELNEMSYNESNPNSRLGDCIEQVSERNKKNEDYTVLSVSNRFGFIEQSEQFEDRTVASENTSNYKIVRYNDFAFNPARINVGSIARLFTFNAGIVSPMYICFRTKKGVLPDYLEPFFSTKYFSLEMDKRLEGSVRMCLSYEGLCDIKISIPSLNNQVKIINRLSSINNKLKNEEQIYNRLLLQKQFLLSQLFI